MTLIQLRYFKAVCQYGSISKAADAIHMSQPSISIAIRDLEKEFGVALFHRENKRLNLTQEGTFFLERISILLNEFDMLSRQMANMGGSGKQITLAIPIFVAKYFFSHSLKNFAVDFPAITLNIKQCNFEDSLKMLEAGTCNMAIVADKGQIPSNYDHVKVLSTEFLYCVSPSNPLSKYRQLDFSQLYDQRLILNQENYYVTTQVKRRFYEQGQTPNIILHAVQLSLIKDLLDAKNAGTFLVKEIAESIPGIVPIPFYPPILLDYVLIWKKDSFLNRSSKMVIDYISQYSTLPSSI